MEIHKTQEKCYRTGWTKFLRASFNCIRCGCIPKPAKMDGRWTLKNSQIDWCMIIHTLLMCLNHMEIRNNETIHRIRVKASTSQAFRYQSHHPRLRIANSLRNSLHACQELNNQAKNIEALFGCHEVQQSLQWKHAKILRACAYSSPKRWGKDRRRGSSSFSDWAPSAYSQNDRKIWGQLIQAR